MTDRFRHELGITYSPERDYVAIDGETAWSYFLAAIGSTDPSSPARMLRELAIDLAVTGPTDDELEAHRRRALRALRDPRLAYLLAEAQARDYLIGLQPTSADDTERSWLAVTSEDVRSCAADFLSTSMLGAPSDTRLEGANWLVPPVVEPIMGTSPFRRRDYPVVADRLALDGPVLQHSYPAGRRDFVLDQLAGVLCYPDGARVLVRRDGYTLAVEPQLWRGGYELVRWIDTVVASELRIPVEPRPIDTIGRPMTTVLSRGWYRVKQIPHRGLVIVTTTWLAVVAALIALGLHGLIVGWFTFAVVLIIRVALEQAHRRRRTGHDAVTALAAGRNGDS